MKKFKITIYLIVFIFMNLQVFSVTIIPPGPVYNGYFGPWDNSGSGGPYIITGNIWVPAGRTLTIGDGSGAVVDVQFSNGGMGIEYHLNVRGCVNAGYNTGPVIFEPTNTSIGWGGIRFYNIALPCTFENCLFSYALKPLGSVTKSPNYCGGAIYINNIGAPVMPIVGFINCSFNFCQSTYGGAFYCDGTNMNSVAIVNSNFANNTATYGGAIYFDNTSNFPNNNTNVDYSNFYYNNALMDGGAFYCNTNSSPVIGNNLINLNTCGEFGGAFYIVNATPDISNNNINGNQALSDGGGVYCLNALSIFDIIYCNLSGNISINGNGGGICLINSIVRIQYNIIHGNLAAVAPPPPISGSSGNGGGIYLDGTGSNNTPKIKNNYIDSNTSSVKGGGIFAVNNSGERISLNYFEGNYSVHGAGIYDSLSTSPEIINNLIAQNYSWYRGGGIYFALSINDPLVNNNTIADNYANDIGGGGGIWSSLSFTNGVFDFGNNIIWDNTDQSGISPANSVLSDPPSFDYPNFQYNDIDGTLATPPPNFNINSDPQFANSAYQLHCTDNYINPPYWVHSPCIDWGLTNCWPYESYDLLGVLRGVVIWGPRSWDLGAYEHNGISPLIEMPGTLYNDINKNINKSINIKVYPTIIIKSTNIELSLTEKNNVNIEIINNIGQLVEVIENKNLDAGEYSFIWTPKHKNTGFYYLKFIVNNNIKVFKLIVEN